MSDSGGALGLVGVGALGLLRLASAHRGAFQGEPMSLVDQAVQDGVPKGGVADARVPVLEGELAGDEGGAAAVAILQDFEQVASGRTAARSCSTGARGNSS
jgi:hypothetical protein